MNSLLTNEECTSFSIGFRDFFEFSYFPFVFPYFPRRNAESPAFVRANPAELREKAGKSGGSAGISSKTAHLVFENPKKRLFDTFSKLKFQAQALQSLTNSRELPLTKSKSSDKERKFKEIRSLDQDCEKSKFYLLSIVHRLEALETNLDRLIDHNLKKSKGN